MGEEEKLTASDGTEGDWFGWSVSISGGRLVVGAWKDDDNGSDSGSAYVFRFDPDSEEWVEEQKLTPNDGAVGDQFGYSATISGERLVVGAYGDDDNGSSSGSAYVFELGDAIPDDSVTTFLRGDADSSGDVSGFPDAFFLLRWEFQGGADPACEDAADADDNGTVSGLTDSLYLLRWQFTDGAEPPAPGTDACAPDLECAEPDELGCEVTSTACQ